MIDNCLSWSDELYHIYGLQKEDFAVTYENYINCTHPEDKEFLMLQITTASKSNTSFNFYHRIIRSDGEIRIINSRGETILDDNGQLLKMTGTAQDVTESKKSEQNILKINEALARKNTELENTRTFLQTVLDSSVELIATFDKNLNYTSVNSNVEESFGKSREFIIGKNVKDIFPTINSTEHIVSFKKALRGETVQISDSRSILHSEKYYESFFIPLIIQGNIEGVMLMGRDITDIKSASETLKKTYGELEQKNLALTQSNAELASFTYIASHDLQEPLRKIQTFCNRILDKEVDLSPGIHDYFSRIVSAATRMQNLITALLNYSRINSAEEAYITTDLNILLDDVKTNLSEFLEENNVTIESGVLPTLKIVPHQISQLFINIIVNASKYKKSGVNPHVVISADISPATVIGAEGALLNKKYWKISISDNGIGFEQQYAEKIFELFQRLHTKQQYEGTGIGLAICKKIIQNHRGFIKAEGQPGIGARFNIYLPLASATYES